MAAPGTDATPAIEVSGVINRFGAQVVALKLTDQRFYHLDTCFCPLEGGHVLYYPEAFDAASRAAIERLVPAARRIAVGEEDALAFACNAVVIGNDDIVNPHALAVRARTNGYASANAEIVAA